MATPPQPRKPQKIINEIIKKTKGQEYIFRGESRDHSEKRDRKPLASNLYRQFCLPSKKENAPPPIKSEHFSILKVEKDIIDKAKAHLPYGATNIDILTQLQHYGGKTALIDFTYNLHIALFFACERNFSQEGKLFMFLSKNFPKKNDIEHKENDKFKFIEQDILMTPTGKDPRVIFQSSVFVHTHKGYIEKKEKIITISPEEKKEILSYLRKNFNIHADTIYNDMHGFIENLENHSTAGIEFYRGVACGQQKKYKEEIRHYDKAIAMNPQFYEAYYNRGVAKYDLGDKENAILDYDKAIDINPQYAKAYYNRGSAKSALGDKENAILDFDKAIDINPQLAEAYYNRGNDKYALGDKENAILDYDKAIEINPQDAKAYNNRGSAKSTLGDKENAILDYDKAIEINPQYAKAYYNRGRAKFALGNKHGAKKDWLQAKKLAKLQNLNDLIEKINEALRMLENEE